MSVTYPRLLAASLLSLAFATVSCSSTPSEGKEATGSPEAATPTQQPTPVAQQPVPQGVEAERTRFLVEEYLKNAQRLRAQGQLTEAQSQLLLAKDLAPQNEQVLRALASVAAELGDRAGSATTYSEQMVRLQTIREERERAEVDRRLQVAQEMLAQNNFSAAIQELRTAQLNMEIGSMVAWGDRKDRVNKLLEDAKKTQDAKERQTRESAEAETLRQLRAQEEAETARRKARVERLLSGAIRAFEQRRFQVAQELSFEAMSLDPTSGMAADLHNSATKALRDSNKDKYIQEKSREYLLAMESMEDLKIPQTDILRRDEAIWERASKRVATDAIETRISPEDQAILEAVQTKTVGKLSFNEETGQYAEVKKVIQTITEVPMIITPDAAKVVADESLVLKIELIAPITLANFLDQMVGRSENLAWRVHNGVVEITTKAKAGGDAILLTHDVRDLVFPVTEFLPPLIRDIPNGQDTGGAPRSGGESDAKVSYIEGDQLVNNIKEATGAKLWEGEGAGTIEYLEGGYLNVKANPRVQERVRQLLEDYRRFATAVVTIDSKFLTISQAFLQEIGVDFRGLGGAGQKGTVATLDDITNGLDDNASRGLDNAGTGDPAGKPSAGAFFNDGGDGDIRARTENYFNGSLGRALSPVGGFTGALVYLDDLQLQMVLRAVEKKQDVQLVNEQRLTVLNTQRANVAVLNQTSYVRDFDVEVAQSAFIADPKVDVIQDGVVLDVKPVISYDRKHVRLNLQPTVAELVRPIPTFTTSLAGSTLPVTLQLPSLTVKSFATTADVPDGGSVLIGGLREVARKERRAEVPILAQIPIVSFLFKQEGVSDENSSLMVLVRARITDVRDEMERARTAAR